MTEIASPKPDGSYPDRTTECELAIKTAFQDLVQRATAAGWSGDEVANAMLMLARNYIDGILADDAVTALTAAGRDMES